MLLKEYLFRKNMTRKDFAIKIGVTPRYMGQLTNGKLPCSRRMASKIEEVTNGIVTFKEAMFPEEYEDQRLSI